MYNVWQEYGYGNWAVVAAFNYEEDAVAYVAEYGGRIVYDARCAGYPEFC